MPRTPVLKIVGARHAVPVREEFKDCRGTIHRALF